MQAPLVVTIRTIGCKSVTPFTGSFLDRRSEKKPEQPNLLQNWLIAALTGSFRASSVRSTGASTTQDATRGQPKVPSPSSGCQPASFQAIYVHNSNVYTGRREMPQHDGISDSTPPRVSHRRRIVGPDPQPRSREVVAPTEAPAQRSHRRNRGARNRRKDIVYMLEKGTPVPPQTTVGIIWADFLAIFGPAGPFSFVGKKLGTQDQTRLL
ncbi:hypothetical protein RF11_15349 [Thelohanellus kitauei]|uniref:Uncharacterized protein n=1 Tax=Thelohanellus kitauei TaxID=669202 RepID=A0A0C2IU02_THEKT|nr:hypothetical protein RF11_15349 [Thelohanellus kitauei]